MEGMTGERSNRKRQRLNTSEKDDVSKRVLKSGKGKPLKVEEDGDSSMGSKVAVLNPVDSGSKKGPSRRSRVVKKATRSKPAKGKKELGSESKNERLRYAGNYSRHFEREEGSVLFHVDGVLASRLCSTVNESLEFLKSLNFNEVEDSDEPKYALLKTKSKEVTTKEFREEVSTNSAAEGNEGSVEQVESTEEVDVAVKDERTIKSGGMRLCTTCHKSMVECVDEWEYVLGRKSTYCSLECLEKQVCKANEVIGDDSSRVMLLDSYGTMLNGPTAPTLGNLLEFLKVNSEFAPVLPYKKSASKILTSGVGNKSKSEDKLQKPDETQNKFDEENYQRRLQVRRVICDKLIARAKKTPGLFFTRLELKNLSQKIEAELFRQCRQSVSGKYRSWFEQMILCLTNENNKGLYLRIIVGELSVPKLVSLDASELSLEKFAMEFEIPSSRHSKPKITNAKTKDVVPKTKNSEETAEDAGPLPEKSTESKQSSHITSSKANEVDEILGIEPVNTTIEHKYHLFDNNCDVCVGRTARGDNII